MGKYNNFKYTREVRELIKNTILNTEDIERINTYKNDKSFIRKRYYPIISDIYILIYKNNISTNILAEIYGVNIRSIQIWLKELNLNRNLKNKYVINKNPINKKFKDKTYGGNERFLLYKFLDENKRVLYIGKCKEIYGQQPLNKNYLLKDRLRQHFSPNSKHLPKSLYLNLKYIEVCYTDVNSNSELTMLENSLISYYERNKFECFYNKELTFNENLNQFNLNLKEDSFNWTSYYTLSEKDIDVLKGKYKIENTPEIEIINERLNAILYVKNNFLID